MKRPVAILLGLAALATGAVALAEAEEALLKRYPYDPACAWGRVGNGKGMVVRCLSEDEAKTLRSAPIATPAAAKPAPAAPSTVAAKPAPEAATAPSSTAPETAPDAATEPEPAPSTDADAALDVAIGPVTADEGSLGLGKLGAPKDKYSACVQKNGGLSAKTGEVSVRFLVRAKGVAEGVSVAKRTNLSKEAAQCVAEVIDRRRVGTPESPMVGATVLVKFTKLDKLPK
jgi:outer membrane biosynthesis protein TonB